MTRTRSHDLGEMANSEAFGWTGFLGLETVSAASSRWKGSRSTFPASELFSGSAGCSEGTVDSWIKRGWVLD